MGNLEEIMDDEELSVWILAELKESKSKTSEWRKSARETYEFYASHQWSEEDQAILDEQGRPAVVFNRCARTINSIAGLEVQNRQEVRYIPRTQEDGPVNEVLTAAAKWVRDNCDGEDEESEAFQDTLICGMGWVNTSLDYEREPDGQIIIERDDPLSYFWDFRAKKRNLEDTRWRCRIHKMSEREVKERWPDWEGKPGEEWIDEDTQPHDADPPFYDGKTQNRSGAKQIEVICFQWFDKADFYRVSTPDGNIVELSETKYKKMSPMFNDMGLKSVKQKRLKYKVAYLIGKDILEQYDLESQKGFTIHCITGLRDRNANSWFGLVHLMIDPQRWANKWLSQTMHIINTNSKGGLMAEKDAFENPKKAEKEWADPSAITWMRAGALQNGKVQQKQIVQLPTGVQDLMRYALESINDVPGVNSELMGLAERNQPGILETTRKQAGVTMLAIFFDGLRRYRKSQGRILAEMIVKFISDGRLIRIVGPNGTRVVPLLKDKLTFEYDVIVDDSPTSPNQKEKVAAILQTMLPNLMQMGVPFIPEILDNLPLPEQMIRKWKEAMPQNNPAMEQMQQAMQVQHQQATDAVQQLQQQLGQQNQQIQQLMQEKQFTDRMNQIGEAQNQLVEKDTELKYREGALKLKEQLAKTSLEAQSMTEEVSREKAVNDMKNLVKDFECRMVEMCDQQKSDQAANSQANSQANPQETEQETEQETMMQNQMMAMHHEVMTSLQEAIKAVTAPCIKKIIHDANGIPVGMEDQVMYGNLQ